MDRELAYAIFKCLSSSTSTEVWITAPWLGKRSTISPIQVLVRILSHNHFQQAKWAPWPYVLLTE